MERQERRGEGEERTADNGKELRKFSRGTGGHFIETQVENEVGEGERVGREQEEELPHPARPHPTQPLAPQKSLPVGNRSC